MFKSNFLKSVLLVSVFGLFTSCSDDNDDNTTVATLETKTATNIYAPQSGGQGQPTSGEFTKFSFSQNAVVTDNSWDIAFRGTTLLVNGGAAVGLTDEPTRTGVAAASTLTNTLAGVTAVPESSTFKQDAASTYAIGTWYNYDATTHIISPTPGKVYVIKTHDGKYAKMEIMSYYKDAPAAPDANSLMRYFTFKFLYQPSGTSF